MVQHVKVDTELVIKAMHLGGHKTKKAAAEEALREYIEFRLKANAFESHRMDAGERDCKRREPSGR